MSQRWAAREAGDRCFSVAPGGLVLLIMRDPTACAVGCGSIARFAGLRRSRHPRHNCVLGDPPGRTSEDAETRSRCGLNLAPFGTGTYFAGGIRDRHPISSWTFRKVDRQDRNRVPVPGIPAPPLAGCLVRLAAGTFLSSLSMSFSASWEDKGGI